MIDKLVIPIILYANRTGCTSDHLRHRHIDERRQDGLSPLFPGDEHSDLVGQAHLTHTLHLQREGAQS